MEDEGEYSVEMKKLALVLVGLLATGLALGAAYYFFALKRPFASLDRRPPTIALLGGRLRDDGL